MLKRARRFVPHAVLLLAATIALVAGVAAAAVVPLPNRRDDFNSPGFIVRHAWTKYALIATSPLRADLSSQEKEQLVRRYFDLTARIERVEREAGDPATAPDVARADESDAARLRAERQGIENRVELVLEGWLASAVEDSGLTRRFGGDVVWPPPDFEFQDPPSVLVRSPRTEIRTESERLLEGDLPIERVEQIEADAERDGGTSALVVEIGGIAMYPAIVPPSSDYRGTLEDIAHEWVHHYLFFTPLGRRYFSSGKLTTLNETVADIVGRELGERMYAAHPLAEPPEASAPSPAPAQPAPQVDFTKTMRDLRRQVEALLAQGEVTRAEALMEQTRQYLADNGYYIRRLNQAYFAFHGSYADTAGSIDPIGPKLDELRQRSGTLRAFVRAAQALRSEADLDAALASGG
jgi:hypothetical protein